MTNTYFDEDSYKNDIDLETNEDVLKRIYTDVQSGSKLAIEFFFLTDSETKALAFKNYLEQNFPAYQEFEISDYEGDFEISGFTDPKEMSLPVINDWNQEMWNIGYRFDCKLDGWQLGI